MPPFFRHPAIPPRPTRVEGEDSREYVERFIFIMTDDLAFTIYLMMAKKSRSILLIRRQMTTDLAQAVGNPRL
ncbi:hypothetical protein [Coleofasciculus chthonoplastes]|uniref:hypothetical protein n=1 Tax=Coleofasciculus chthonoplastes TaxID=64178 RepID=UPI0033049FC1